MRRSPLANRLRFLIVQASETLGNRWTTSQRLRTPEGREPQMPETAPPMTVLEQIRLALEIRAADFEDEDHPRNAAPRYN